MPKKRRNKSKLSKIATKEESISREEKRIEQKEEEIEQLEQSGLDELKKLEKLERKVSQEVSPHPLLKITYQDVIRSAIGSLFGILGHFSFFYGVEIAEKISLTRATVLYLISLLVIFGFMYYSGFRKVKEIKILSFIPIRALIIYFTALSVVLLVLLVFDFINLSSHWEMIYKAVSTISLLAVLGAATADLLGHE